MHLTLRIITYVLLFLSLLANLWFWNSSKTAEESLRVCEEKEVVFKQQYELLKRDLLRTGQNLAIMRMPGNVAFPLSGAAGSPGSKAVVYWNNIEKTVFVDANGLPNPPGGWQYQLWVLQGGNYLNGGVFNYQPDKDNLFQLRNTGKPEGFMVTLELIPGAKQPNLEKVVAKTE